MATKQFLGPAVRGEKLHGLLSKYGMYLNLDTNKVEFNDHFTIIILRSTGYPVLLPHNPSISHELLESRVQNLEDIIEVRYSMDTTEICDGAFVGCINLSAVQGGYGNNLWEIGDHAFQGCENLKYFEVDLSNVVSIAANAFEDCSVETISCKYTDDYVAPNWSEADVEHARQMEAIMKGHPLVASGTEVQKQHVLGSGASSGRDGRGKKSGKPKECPFPCSPALVENPRGGMGRGCYDCSQVWEINDCGGLGKKVR